MIRPGIEEITDNLPVAPVVAPTATPAVESVSKLGAAAPAPVEQQQYNFIIGAYAGAELSKLSNYNILIGMNAGRNLRDSVGQVIIGDNYFGDASKSDQFYLDAKCAPAIPDAHLVTVIQSIAIFLEKHFQQFVPALGNKHALQVKQYLLHLIEVYQIRVRLAQNAYACEADTVFLASEHGYVAKK